MPPRIRSAMVTTGLKCAPEIGPSARISATSAAPVAVEFSSSCKSDVARRQPLRGDARADHDRNEERGADGFGARAPDQLSIDHHDSAAARRRTRARSRNTSASSAPGRPCAARRGHLDVGEHRVDLPRLTVGRVDPHLVLHRVATRHLVLGRGGEPVADKPRLRGGDLGGGFDLDPEVVQRARLAAGPR